jgi:tRNA pseudouridine13 synthase
LFFFNSKKTLVDRDGNVARLESLELPSVDPILKEEAPSNDTISSTVVAKRPVPDGEASDEKPDTKKPKLEDCDETEKEHELLLEQARVELSDLVGAEAALEAIQMLQHWQTNKNSAPAETQPKHVTLPKVEDKLKRRAIHMLIRSPKLAPFAAADTVDSRVRIWHKSFESEMPDYDKFERGARNNNSNNKQGGRGGGRPQRPPKAIWPADRPDYLKFVLYKENIDTGTAVKDILRFSKMNPRNKGGVGYAGMKDKRGVTAQFCTVFRQEPNDLLVLNQHNQKQYSGSGGGGSTSTGGVPVLRVGNFSYTKEELKLGKLSGNRFDICLRNIHVDGMDTNTDNGKQVSVIKSCLEQAALDMKEKGFINYFGMQRFGKYHDTHKVGIALLKGDFEEAVSIIMSPKQGEMDRVVDARGRWERRFADVSSQDDEKAMEAAEQKCAKGVLRDLGRFMTAETSIVTSLSRKPRDYKRAFRSISKNLRLMFLHAYQSYLWNFCSSQRVKQCSDSVMVGDLVQTEDKAEHEGGSGTSGLGGKAVITLTEEDVASGKYSMTDVVLPMAGVKIQYPTNSVGDLFDKLLAENGLTKKNFDNLQDRELSLGGDYRKIICKPTDVDVDIMQYKDPLEPLIQTEMMKLNNVNLNVRRDMNNTEDGVLTGMAIGFTLPPSAYATVALRELMKKPTSSEYQKELKLS